MHVYICSGTMWTFAYKEVTICTNVVAKRTQISLRLLFLDLLVLWHWYEFAIIGWCGTFVAEEVCASKGQCSSVRMNTVFLWKCEVFNKPLPTKSEYRVHIKALLETDCWSFAQDEFEQETFVERSRMTSQFPGSLAVLCYVGHSYVILNAMFAFCICTLLFRYSQTRQGLGRGRSSCNSVESP